MAAKGTAPKTPAAVPEMFGFFGKRRSEAGLLPASPQGFRGFARPYGYRGDGLQHGYSDAVRHVLGDGGGGRPNGKVGSSACGRLTFRLIDLVANLGINSGRYRHTLGGSVPAGVRLYRRDKAIAGLIAPNSIRHFHYLDRSDLG